MKQALTLNAVFSGLSGILLILFHGFIASVFNVFLSEPFWIIGIGLLFFAGIIIYQIKKLAPNGILFIILQDLLWVIGSIYMLIANPFEISLIGNVSIAIVALIVLIMATNQYIELAKYVAGIDYSLRELSFIREVNAGLLQTWNVVSDVGNYHKIAPDLDTVEIHGEGTQMIRTCHHGKKKWSETCISWEPEKKYTFSVNTNDPGSPYKMFRSIIGTWEIEKIDREKTRITMTFQFAYKRLIHLILLHPLLKLKFTKMASILMDNLVMAIANLK